jgi:hypothetical protein
MKAAITRLKRCLAGIDRATEFFICSYIRKTMATQFLFLLQSTLKEPKTSFPV